MNFLMNKMDIEQKKQLKRMLEEYEEYEEKFGFSF